MLTQKTPPSVGDAQLNRVIQQIYRDLNEVIAKLPSGTTDLPKATDAADGTVRVTKQIGTQAEVKDAAGNVVSPMKYVDINVVSIKTPNGWINSAANIFTEQKKTDT